ncbi:MAG: DNA-directed RNA polymerase core subunit rpc10 [Alectoria sarmentosa]|nr:MAG: DNA-directed RNA polymerase core subunit rpc10 [Alectoria sarmentosa]
MSREAYAPPTLQPSNSQFNTATTDIAGPSTPYKCGECNAEVHLKKGEPIRCGECGHRVLYKMRTKRMVQFEAR